MRSSSPCFIVVLGRVLDPLAHLSKGMLSLEDGHYATRLALPKVKELAVITQRFNTLAGALDTARDENSRLYRQLITVQEEERREIANELHDEAGPCLFGITANASSIQNLADQRPDKSSAEISRRVGEILSITERLKLLNRALLKKLRPIPLGRTKLAELLDELIAGFKRRHPDVHIAVPSASWPNPMARPSTSRSIAAFRRASPTPSATARREPCASILRDASHAPQWRSSDRAKLVARPERRRDGHSASPRLKDLDSPP